MRTPFLISLGLFAAVPFAASEAGSEPLRRAQTGGRWWPVTAGRPSARSLHAMAYDSRRGVTVLFGGSSAEDPYLADTWEWDGSSWIQKATTGPKGRNGHVMCYDSARGITLLFGGFNGGQLGDTWAWDGTRWRLLTEVGPSDRSRAALAFDSGRSVAVLFGGFDGTRSFSDDTWEWNGESWNHVAGMGPAARSNHAMAYDRALRQVVLFGGDDPAPGYLADSWTWDGRSWNQLRKEMGPSPRHLHAMTFDELNARVVLFGGSNPEVLGDTWEFQKGKWAPTVGAGPDARYGHAMAYDAARNIAVLFGGAATLERPLYDTWALTRPPPPGASTLDDPAEVRIPRVFDSGLVPNDAAEPVVVFRREVQTPGAGWSRAYFSTIDLEPGSLLRITSLLDRQVQELDRFTARMWGWNSAYFNGDRILIEVVAAPHTRANRVALAAIGVPQGALFPCHSGPCGTCNPDGRFPSNEDWSGRYTVGGCTASIYNENGCFVSAGHCWIGGGSALWFRNPLSLNNCDSHAPSVEDQFPVIATNADGTPCTPDWRVGKIGLNSLGQTHFQRYGPVHKPLATALPPVSGAARIYGFGASLTPVVNNVQQLTLETLTNVSTSSLNYSGGTTTGGTSGSGVVHNFTAGGDAIVGINTCCSAACAGIASWINQPSFVTARQLMCPHTVHAPWDAPFCLNNTQISAQVTVCNTSGTSDSFQLSFADLPIGPGCSVAGPTSFTVTGSNPIGPIPAGQCLTASVVIARPPGLTAAWLTGCYAITATSMNSGTTVTEHGSVQDRRDLCTGFFNDFLGPATLTVGVPRRLEFSVENTALDSGRINYRVEAFAPDMEPSGAISLDRGYFGVPSHGTVDIPRGSTGRITVEVLNRWFQPFEISDLVISTDIDGDGRYEPLTSIGVRSVEPRCRADINGEREVNVADLQALLRLFQEGDPSADVNSDGRVNIKDLLSFLTSYAEGC